MVFAQPLNTEEDLTGQSPLNWPAEMREPDPVLEDQSGLYSAYQLLRNAPGFRPLLHLAWLQPAASGQVNPPYHVSGETVEGTVSIERGEYLYALVDMQYRAADGSIYQLRERRQIKLGEVHYLDHPAFGVLIRVAPAQVP